MNGVEIRLLKCNREREMEMCALRDLLSALSLRKKHRWRSKNAGLSSASLLEHQGRERLSAYMENLEAGRGAR
jgi:hypothetical protein